MHELTLTLPPWSTLTLLVSMTTFLAVIFKQIRQMAQQQPSSPLSHFLSDNNRRQKDAENRGWFGASARTLSERVGEESSGRRSERSVKSQL